MIEPNPMKKSKSLIFIQIIVFFQKLRNFCDNYDKITMFLRTQRVNRKLKYILTLLESEVATSLAVDNRIKYWLSEIKLANLKLLLRI